MVRRDKMKPDAPGPSGPTNINHYMMLAAPIVNNAFSQPGGRLSPPVAEPPRLHQLFLRVS